ncbi:MAG: electron transport complex subunit RsxC [Chromatiaceae bacterium]|nr:electron transport complex subunit RsxC [Chromatiaceae bacterium]MCP5444450.1 electron transport complex subunit RsxC [Chromatiaceae bacterium]
MKVLSKLIEYSFAHGVHPRENKEATVSLPIQRMPFVNEYVMPLNQQLGAQCKPVVEPGERVVRGQLIAEPGAFISTNLHSPATGWVRAIDNRRYPGGVFARSIVIEADPYDSQQQPNAARDWRHLTPEQFVAEIQLAGIVGMGGAAFPAHAKYSIPEGQRIDHILVNGAECEPFLTNDHRMMVERPDALLLGIDILLHNLGAKSATIGVETNKPDAIDILRGHIRPDQPIKVAPLRVKYPQGAEKMLIKSIFDKEVPAGGLPRDLGMVVNNVGSVLAIADWFQYGMPLIERVVTVSGDGVRQPSNLLVPIGTPLREVLKFCDGLKDDVFQVVMGGPMMGTSVASLDVPVLKGTSGILAFRQPQSQRTREYACIRCGRCLEACPYFLNPSRLAKMARSRLYEEMQQYSVMDCVECGSCTYSCPSNIPIVQLIRTAKSQIRQSAGKVA